MLREVSTDQISTLEQLKCQLEQIIGMEKPTGISEKRLFFHLYREPYFATNDGPACRGFAMNWRRLPLTPLLGKRGPGTFNSVWKLLICLAISIKTKISPKANVIPNIFEINLFCSIYFGTVKLFLQLIGNWCLIVLSLAFLSSFLNASETDKICHEIFSTRVTCLLCT